MAEYDDKCPVCGNEESFSINAAGSEWASLVSNGIGGVTLTACSECGCVYVKSWYRKRYKRLKEDRNSNG